LSYRIGVDIGGTFTDAILIDMDTGSMVRSKVPTTPRDPAKGFVNSVERVMGDVDPADVLQAVHATTIATNAIIEGRVAKGALVVTKGFRDMLEIQRQIRPKLYDLFFDKPKPLIPRQLCFEVDERMTAEGEVLRRLDEGEVREVARALKREGVETVAICFLHSYLDPSHELRAARIISDEYPEVYVTPSCKVSLQFREYFRASTAVINAVIMPIVAGYLARLEGELKSRGFALDLYLMQSSGGLMKSAMAKERPAYIVESGPAAGTIATSYVTKLLGFENAISFDMGGTTAKVGLIEGSVPRIASSYEVGAVASAEIGGLTRGSGYPLRTPVVDLVEIGAGGGSIAWVDSGGALRVGPRSAGADPGPACYPNGGKEPTVTDANLLLARLDPGNFLGGEMKLNPESARRAIKERCGDLLGQDPIETANGIIEIANESMLRALRLASVERGYDPREFVLTAFGGAGPMHANALAKELNIPKVLVPPSPGLFSALGLLVTDLKHDYIQTYISNLSEVDMEKAESIFWKFEKQARSTLKKEGMADRQVTLARFMDVRYIGQSYELTVRAPVGSVSDASLSSVRKGFHAAHERAYGHSAPEQPVEVVNLRVTGIGTTHKPSIAEVPKGGREPLGALRGSRDVLFPEGRERSGVYDRYRLKQGNVVTGPAIIEEADSTTVVYPGYRTTVKRWGFLLIEPVR
jgi:N-methylhydantoinase A